MGFLRKFWLNWPSTTTPVDAAGLNDLEERIETGFVEAAAHAASHASAGSDPMATASLDPTVLNAESPYTQIQTGTSGTVYVTSSTAVWLTGCEVTVQAGQRAFLVCRFDVNIEEGGIFALFIADNPSKTNISQEAYVATSATGWNRLSPVLFGFVAPASDTKYVVGGKRIAGSKQAQINPQTTLAKIVLGGIP